jgi:hypothetical protein
MNGAKIIHWGCATASLNKITATEKCYKTFYGRNLQNFLNKIERFSLAVLSTLV